MTNNTEDPELVEIQRKKIAHLLEQAQAKSHHVQNLQGTPTTLTDASFLSEVAKQDLIVVDFWAPWCGPCRMVGPIIEQLSAEYAGRVVFGKMNVDENQRVPSSFGIMSIPTIIILNHGKEVERLVGVYPKAHIEAMIKRYLR